MTLITLLAGSAVAMLLVTAAFAGHNKETAKSTPVNEIKLLEANQNRLLLELQLSEFQIESIPSQDGECSVLHVEGLGEMVKPGWPRLPVKGALVGIPPGVVPTVEILESDTDIVPVVNGICPAPSPVVEIDLDSELESWAEIMKADPQAYNLDSFFPENLVEIESTGYLRSQRVLKILFYPFQYNPEKGMLHFNKRIVVEIKFQPSIYASSSQEVSYVDEGSFEAVLSDSLINYEHAKEWRKNPPRIMKSNLSTPANSQSSYKLVVDQDGVYKVTYNDLITAGVPVGTINPQTLQLFNQGN